MKSDSPILPYIEGPQRDTMIRPYVPRNLQRAVEEVEEQGERSILLFFIAAAISILALVLVI